MANNNDFMTKYFELGDALTKLAGRKDIIQIDVETALEVGNNIEDEARRLKFFGRHYLDLVEELKEAGLINL